METLRLRSGRSMGHPPKYENVWGGNEMPHFPQRAREKGHPGYCLRPGYFAFVTEEVGVGRAVFAGHGLFLSDYATAVTPLSTLSVSVSAAV